MDVTAGDGKQLWFVDVSAKAVYIAAKRLGDIQREDVLAAALNKV